MTWVLSTLCPCLYTGSRRIAARIVILIIEGIEPNQDILAPQQINTCKASASFVFVSDSAMLVVDFVMLVTPIESLIVMSTVDKTRLFAK